MPQLAAGGVVRDIDVVVLDKDGTLVDFDLAWRGRLARAIRAVAHAAEGDERLVAELHRALGSAGENGAIFPDGPYLSGTLGQNSITVATVLYQHGVSWNRAQAIAESRFHAILTAPPELDEIRGIGDVVTRLGQLKAHCMRIAIATNDERASTLIGLRHLGIADLVDIVVCAGDAGLASKPAPDGLLHIAGTLGIAPDRLAMVGDSISDMMTGKAAGAGLTIGVLSGPSTAEHLGPHADVIVPDIHALSVSS